MVAACIHRRLADMENSYTCVYDAWNRLVQVSAGATTVAEYRYDGLGRRIRKYVPDGEDWTVTEYYYSAGWQVLEVRRDDGKSRSSEPTLATTLREQYVWSPRYIDAPILRDRDNAAGGHLGKTGSGLDERLYYLTDANFNVTTLVNTGGDAVERYTYDPYGKLTIYDGTWSSTQAPTTYNNEVLYCGYRYDTETGLYQVRNRYYSTELGRSISRDPLGYGAGDVNLYRYVGNRPLMHTDPTGLYESGNSSGNYPWFSDPSITLDPKTDRFVIREPSGYLPFPEGGGIGGGYLGGEYGSGGIQGGGYQQPGTRFGLPYNWLEEQPRVPRLWIPCKETDLGLQKPEVHFEFPYSYFPGEFPQMQEQGRPYVPFQSVPGLDIPTVGPGSPRRDELPIIPRELLEPLEKPFPRFGITGPFRVGPVPGGQLPGYIGPYWEVPWGWGGEIGFGGKPGIRFERKPGIDFGPGWIEFDPSYGVGGEFRIGPPERQRERPQKLRWLH